MPLALAATLAAGSALRLLIFLAAPDIAASLERRPETSTPVSSYTALREAVHLQALADSQGQGAHPIYSGGSNVIHHSPLVVASLGPVVRSRRAELATALLWTSFDALSAWALYRCAMAKARTRSRVAQTHSNPKESALELDDELMAHRTAIKAAALYLANPFNLLSCLSRSTTPLSSCLTLLAVKQAMEGHGLLATFFLSLATHTSLYPILQLPPLLLILRQQRRIGPSGSGTANSGLALFSALVGLVLGLGGGTYAAWELQGRSWDWIYQSWGAIILLTDLTPNIGMWWYFIMEMFDHFRDFFLLTLNVHVLSYVAPFSIKFRNDPLFAVTALSGIIATFQSYPTVGDAGLFWGLMALHPEIFPYLRHPLVTALFFAYTALLLPTFQTLWLGPGSRSGSGNANFFYAITLVWGLGGAAGVLDACWAWGRAQWERERRGNVALAARIRGQHGQKKSAARRVVVQM